MVWEMVQYFLLTYAVQEQKLNYWIVGILQFHLEHTAHIIVMLGLNVKVGAVLKYR